MHPQDPGATAWVLERAQTLASAQGLNADLQRWLHNARLLFLLLCGLAVLSGVTASLGFFGSEMRSVNVIWTLMGLIAVHMVALLLWLLAGRFSGGLLGRFWFWAVAHMPGAGRSQGAARDGPARALATLMYRDGLGKWSFACITHSLWLLALSASLLTMLLALSLRSYSFVLETTILTDAVFQDVVYALAWLPSKLGFAVPDAQMIAAALHPEGALQAEDARRAWASWLSGALVVYAILPRLLVWTLSMLQWLRLRAALRPDLQLPGYAQLFHAAARSRGVVDAPLMPAPVLRIHAPHRVAGNRLALVAVELGSDISWPPAGFAQSAPESVLDEVVETREQRQAVLARLSLAPPARLLVACDLRVSPDRGTLHWLVALSAHCGEIGVWLLAAEPQEQARHGVWQQTLSDIGFPAAAIVDSESAALNWLHSHA